MTKEVHGRTIENVIFTHNTSLQYHPMKRLLLYIGIIILSANGYGQIYDSWGDFLYMDSIDFDPLSDWITIPGEDLNIWEAGIPDKQLFRSSLSGKAVIITGSNNSYPVSVDDHFILSIPLTDQWNYLWPEVILSFYHKFDTDSLYDGGIIEVSYDGGDTWINVLNDYKNVYHHFHGLYEEGDTIDGGTNAFTGRSDNWEYVELQWVWLALTKGATSDLYTNPIFKFRFISDEMDNYRDGWMIDQLVFRSYDVSGSIDRMLNSDIIIYPNPCMDHFFIQSRNVLNHVRLFLYHSDGRIVANQEIPIDTKVSTTDYLPGIYFYKIIDDDRGIIKTGKLVVTPTGSPLR